MTAARFCAVILLAWLGLPAVARAADTVIVHFDEDLGALPRIHGVNSGPLVRKEWRSVNPPTIDMSAEFAATRIPESRAHDEGAGDMQTLWAYADGSGRPSFAGHDPTDDASWKASGLAMLDERMTAAESVGVENLLRCGYSADRDLVLLEPEISHRRRVVLGPEVARRGRGVVPVERPARHRQRGAAALVTARAAARPPLAGKYRVDKVLGVGGMGVVVAAHHLQLDEKVALKFLLPEMLSNAEAVARFERTALGGSGPDMSMTKTQALMGSPLYMSPEQMHYNGVGTCSAVKNIAPVGSAPNGAGRWGQLDLAGSVWEWALDWYASAYNTPCTNCANIAPASDRVYRGGGFYYGAPYLLSPSRSGTGPSGRGFDIAGRCARTP